MNLEKLRNNLYIFFTYHTNQSNFRVGHQVDNDKKQVIPRSQYRRKRREFFIMKKEKNV